MIKYSIPGIWHEDFILQCFGNIDSSTLAQQICELGLIIGLIIGRWLLPRGEITRDQLSALLLGYVGTAADILELFEVLQEEVVQQEEQVTFAVLGVYTWSLLQFCLVTTATTGKNNQIRITNNKVGEVQVLLTTMLYSAPLRKKGGKKQKFGVTFSQKTCF